MSRNQEVRLNMLRLFSRLLYVVTLMTLLSGVSLLAQSITARFSGQVTDTDGSAIPGASIQIIDQESLAKRETKTDASGGYSVANLAPGRYQIVVEADGFALRGHFVGFGWLTEHLFLQHWPIIVRLVGFRTLGLVRLNTAGIGGSGVHCLQELALRWTSTLKPYCPSRWSDAAA